MKSETKKYPGLTIVKLTPKMRKDLKAKIAKYEAEIPELEAKLERMKANGVCNKFLNDVARKIRANKSDIRAYGAQLEEGCYTVINCFTL